MTDPKSTAREPIVSPCRSVCAIDPKSNLCLGCFRSLPEIAKWAKYSDAERAAIMADLPAREKAAGPNPFGLTPPAKAS